MAMWARDERCKEVIEMAWDPPRASTDFGINKRIESCQFHLQRWNHKVFGNANKRLKHLQDCLHHLEAQNFLHETVGEIQALRKEINETLNRKEVMWNQRSISLWLKCGDRNTKFFQTTVSQRRRKNKIEGLNDNGVWFKS